MSGKAEAVKGLEIEKKYLLRPCSPKIFLDSLGLTYRKYMIAQYYLPPKSGELVRYRKRDREYFKTIKSGEGLVRQEYEVRVEKEEFDRNVSFRSGKIIKKQRFVFVYQERVYEMDRFRKALDGLCYLEIEFDGESEARNFELPEIFSPLLLAEVTADKRFSNASISMCSALPSLDTDLQIFAKRVTFSLASKEDSGKKSSLLMFAPYESSVVAIQAIFEVQASGLEQQRLLLGRLPGKASVLHGFRIAIRKLKSSLDAYEDFLLPEWYALHRRNLSLLIAQTNTYRDRDVLLRKIPYYRKRLPGKNAKGMDLLEKYLVEEKVISDTHIQTLSRSELLFYEITSLQRPRLKSCHSGERIVQPIVMTAREVVEDAVDRLEKKEKRLSARLEDISWHQLRIRYKRVRYTIEALASLIASPTYDRVMKQIKKRQSLLGDLQDYVMQSALLHSLLQEPKLQSKAVQKTLKRLLTEIDQLKQKQKVLCKRKCIREKKDKKWVKKLFEYS